MADFTDVEETGMTEGMETGGAETETTTEVMATGEAGTEMTTEVMDVVAETMAEVATEIMAGAMAEEGINR